MQKVELLAVPGLPMVKAGDDLARLIGERLTGELALQFGLALIDEKRAPASGSCQPTSGSCQKIVDT